MTWHDSLRSSSRVHVYVRFVPAPRLLFKMGASEELEYLKSLVSQLNEKIAAIEAKAKGSPSLTPAQQLRTILIGPPGAGMFMHV